MLDGNFFSYWSNVMGNLIKAKKLWGYVIGTCVKPKSIDKDYVVDIGTWEANNAKNIT